MVLISFLPQTVIAKVNPMPHRFEHWKTCEAPQNVTLTGPHILLKASLYFCMAHSLCVPDRSLQTNCAVLLSQRTDDLPRKSQDLPAAYRPAPLFPTNSWLSLSSGGMWGAVFLWTRRSGFLPSCIIN